jgi:two-component system NtrC family response regulator
MKRLLLIDDNEDILTQLKWGLASEGWELHYARDADEALALFAEVAPQVVTLDLGLPPEQDNSSEGFRCLQEMLTSGASSRIIVITGNDDRKNALKAVQSGAYDFFRKPIDLDELRVIIRRAFHLCDIEAASSTRRERDGDPAERHGIIGDCAEMRTVLDMIDRVAASDVPVLISGESGTGKELVARAMHAASHRREGPMVTVNCGAIPETLLETEFFGHERGAFTGANAQVKGKVEYADQGTLFLDEIGELPMNLQVKLLRFLQEMVFQRVGGRKDIEVNVRIVAATNVDIDKAIARGEFREDLFYRISVVNLHLPPLRERGDDVRLLAEHFLRNLSSDLGREITGFTPEAQAFLASYDWPGNIRELENKVRRAVVMADGARLTPSDLGFTGNGHRGEEPALLGATLREARASVEKKLVRSALARCKGNILKASEALGISRPTMYDLLKKHDIQNPGHR